MINWLKKTWEKHKAPIIIIAVILYFIIFAGIDKGLEQKCVKNVYAEYWDEITYIMEDEKKISNDLIDYMTNLRDEAERIVSYKCYGDREGIY